MCSQVTTRLPALQERPSSSQGGYTRDDDTIHLIGFLWGFMGFPGGSGSKESTCSEGDLGLIPGLGRSPGEGKDYPLQHSGLENSMDCIVHSLRHRGWDGWTASPTRWTWVWASSGSWWWTGKPGVLHWTDKVKKLRMFRPLTLLFIFFVLRKGKEKSSFLFFFFPFSPQWDIWFSLIYSKTFNVQTTWPMLQNFYTTWLLPSPPWSSLLRVTWEAVSPA